MSVREFLRRRFHGAPKGRAVPLRARVGTLDSLDVASQLGELRDMEDGWLDGEGQAPPRHLIDWLAGSFKSHYPDDAEPPYLYPTVEGGVQAEWSLGSHEVSLRFHPDDRTGDWHDLALDTDREETRQLDLEQARDWEWLGARVVPLAGR